MSKKLNQAQTDDLARYMAEVRQYPMLDAATEARLVESWRKHRDPKAADQLVGSHLRLVIKIARGFLGYGLPLGDLIAEGNLGLMQALNRFDPAHGTRFSTYAIWWVRAQLQDYVMRAASLVRIGTTAAQKRLFFNLRRVQSAHGEIGGGDLAPEAAHKIATELDVRDVDVIEMSRRLAARDASLNERVESDGEAEWQDFLVDDEDDQETRMVESDQFEQRRAMVDEALGKLTERERHILTARRLSENPPTLEDLSHRYGVSRERVRQIEARALEKLGASVRRQAASA